MFSIENKIKSDPRIDDMVEEVRKNLSHIAFKDEKEMNASVHT